MRLAPLLIGAFLLTGCGAAMAEEQPAAETSSARIAVSGWDGEPTTGAFDLRDGSGVVDGREILAVDAVYTPIEQYYETVEKQPAGVRGKRWLKSPRADWDPFLLAPLANDAVDLIGLLRSAERGEAVDEGQERGEPVSYYTATIRMDEYMATLTPAERAEVSDSYAEWEGVVFHLAVDSEGRFRKAEFAFGDGDDLVIEIFDYGVPVNAAAPDPSTVLTWEEYGKLLREECERLKKQGREKEAPHCTGGCGAGEGESASTES